MSVVTLGARGASVPVVVWERYADIAQWSQWAPQIQRVETAADRIAPGVTGSVFGLLGVRVDFVIDAVDEGQYRWSWTVTRMHVSVRLDHAVREHPKGVSTSLTMDGALPLVLGYAPVAQLALRKLVRP